MLKEWLSYFFFVFALFLFCFTFLFSGASKSVVSLRDQLRIQKNERAEVHEEVSRFKNLLVGIESDPAVLEKLAREELKVIGEDEELIIFQKRKTKK